MKKYVVLACAVMIASTSAFASKARMIALGEDADGSFYINDVRNVFLNPAMINNHKDTVTMEWGASDATADADDKPNTEAGIFHDAGKLVYGAYLGSRANKFTSMRSGSLTTSYNTANFMLQAQDTLDLFVGGEAGMKWGASLTHSSTSDENTTYKSEQTLTVLKLGVAKNNWGGFVHYVAANEAEDKVNTEKFEMDSDLSVGGHLDRGAYRYYLSHRMYEVDGGNENTETHIGITRVKNVNDKAKLYTKVDLRMEEEDSVGEEMGVALTIGLEADVKNWLALRASISQDLYAVNETAAGKKKTPADTTNVNAGATFKFGDLSVDGLIGTGDGAGNAGTSSAEKGVLSLDNLMTRVSLTYKY